MFESTVIITNISSYYTNNDYATNNTKQIGGTDCGYSVGITNPMPPQYSKLIPMIIK